MLIIKPIQTKREQEDICAGCGVQYNPDALAYAAREDDALLGVSQFRILGKYAEVYDLHNAEGVDDLEALIIMGRAVLNFVDLCGVKEAYINTTNRSLHKTLGFREREGRWHLSLEGYFNSPCKGGEREGNG